MAETEKLIPIRCTNCGAILYETKIFTGTIVKKCKCGVTNTQTTMPASQFKDRLNLSTKHK